MAWNGPQSMSEDAFPEGLTAGIVVRLLHAATREMLTARISESDYEAQRYPEWVVSDNHERNGRVTVGADDESHLRMTLRAAFTQERVAVKVVIEGLYEVDSRSEALMPGDVMYDRVPTRYRQVLAELAVDELYPYLREAVHRASAIVYPIHPILLEPPGGAVHIPHLD